MIDSKKSIQDSSVSTILDALEVVSEHIDGFRLSTHQDTTRVVHDFSVRAKRYTLDLKIARLRRKRALDRRWNGDAISLRVMPKTHEHPRSTWILKVFLSKCPNWSERLYVLTLLSVAPVQTVNDPL